MKLFNEIIPAERHLFFYGKLINRFITVLVLLFVLMFTFSCGNSASERAEQSGGITAGKIIENPAAYVGKTVTVSGDVEEIFGPQAFSMDSGSSMEELLVVGREPFPQVTEAENRVYVISDVATVTGVVQMLVTTEVEKEIGWDLTPEIVARFNAKPVLIAKTISFRPNQPANSTGSVNPANGQPNGNTNNVQPAVNANYNSANENTNSQANNEKNNSNKTAVNSNTGSVSNQTTENKNIITDVGTYGSTNDKLSLIDKEAQFSNVRVNRVVGPRTFTVGSGKSELYVMLNDESARGVGSQGNIAVGDHFNIKGRFERLNSAEISNIADNRFRPLTDQERAFLKTTQVYLQSSEINKTQ